MENFKWKIRKKIKNFRNLKNIDFEFIRGGITIIIGENNIGKTNLLDYIYEENKDWDNFEVDDESYEKEESEHGLIPSYRSSYSLLELFFPEQAYSNYYRHLPYRLASPLSPYLMHASNPRFVERKKEAKMILSYRIYYFDLTASISFLNEKDKKKLVISKIRSSNCELLYGKFEEEKTMRDYFITESREKSKEKIETWAPYFNNETNFIKSEEGGEITYWGFNKNIFHPLDKLGSGYLKHETIKSLLEHLKNEQQFQEGEFYRYKVDKDKWLDEDEWKRKKSVYPKFVHTPILLMDEPEIFLHPSFISELAESIKKAEEKNITTILTTHSPSFLSHFVSEMFSNDEANLIIVQKNKDGNLNSPSYLSQIVEEIKKEIVGKEEDGKKIDGVWKSYCPCFKKEIESDDKFYYNKWKILLNEHTLKVFFSKNILFVEGITDYVLFTSEFLRREIPELRKIEIIPIFGKLNYIFLSKLAQKININCRFLLDKDNDLIEKAKRIESKSEESKEIKGTNLKKCKHEPKCTQEQVHKTFWDIHTKGRLEEEKEEDIICDSEGEIDWFKKNIEHFLEVESKDKFMVSKELAMLNKLRSLDELKWDEPEDYKKWKGRVSKLRKVIGKIFSKPFEKK